MNFLIYKTTNKINGKIYIGAHITNNIYDKYLGSGKILKKAINKYGINNFTKEVLYRFKNKEAMFFCESIIIDDNFIKNENNYNLRLGGFGGWDYINSKSSKNKGKAVVVDKNGNKHQVSIDDPRYLSRELRGHTYKKITVKDSSGKTMMVSNTDPRYLSGELVAESTGLIPVKDKNGNKFRVSKDDPRYLSGEFVAISRGRKFKMKTKLICPYCNKKGSGGSMRRWHFDNCRHKL